MKEGHTNKKAWCTGRKIKRNKNSKVIQRGRNFRRAAFGSGCGLVLLLAATVCPLAKNTEYTEAAAGNAKESTLIFSAAAVNKRTETPMRDNQGAFGTFMKVDTMRFAIETNNYTGYTVMIKSNAHGREATQLSNGTTVLNSISHPVSEADFMDGEIREYDNKWGILPNKFNSVDNTDYLPAPSSTAILDVTSKPNATANEYDIAVGARIGYANASGTYTNDTFVIEYVANPVNYSITYDANTDDGVADMPVPLTQGGAASATSIALDESVPTRTGYTFGGWCATKPVVVEGAMNCESALYDAGGVFGIDQTTYNITILYAMWSANIYDVTIRTAEGVSSVSLNGVECDSPEGCVVSGLTYGATYALEANFEPEYVLIDWTNTEGVGKVSEDGMSYTVGTGATTLIPSATMNSYEVTVELENAKSVTFTNEKYGEQRVEAEGGAVSLKHGVPYVITAEFEDGYVFGTWTAVSGEEEREIKADKVLYRVTSDGALKVSGREKAVCNAEATTIDEAVCMQDVNSGNVEVIRGSMEKETEYTLYDVRDNKPYVVMLNDDNAIVMKDELDLNLVDGMTLTSLDTDINVSGEGSYEEGYVVEEDGVIRWTPATQTVELVGQDAPKWDENKSIVYSVNKLAEGRLANEYNFAAVMAVSELGEVEGEEVTNLGNSICPKGWTVPSMTVKMDELAKGVKVKCEARM